MALQYSIPGASSSGEQVVGGVGVSCSVTYSNFLLNTTGSLVTSFSVTISETGDGRGSSSLDITYRRKYIVVNGVTVYDQGSNIISFTSDTYPGGIQSIALFARIEVRGNSGIYKASAQVGQVTYYPSVINPTTDFVFSTSAAVGSSYKVVLLPSSNLYTGRTLFIKDAIGHAGSTQNIIVVPTTANSFDNSQSTFFINQNNGCLTLMTNGTTKWIIANMYPSNNQPILPSAINPNKVAILPPNLNTLNTVSFISSNDRGSGDTLTYLPRLNGQPGMAAIVYYGGTTYARGAGNALIINSINSFSNPIDRLYTTTSPYIYCDSSAKSTAAFFITDGSIWYIAGWAPTPGWDWSNSEGGYHSISTTSGSNRDLNIIASDTNKFYTLPSSVPNTQYMIVLKSTTVSGNGIRFFTAANLGTFTNKFNTSSNGIYWTGNQANNCYWLVTYNTGSNLLYFPLILYTP
jgi:hypothetical protein